MPYALRVPQSKIRTGSDSPKLPTGLEQGPHGSRACDQVWCHGTSTEAGLRQSTPDGRHSRTARTRRGAACRAARARARERPAAAGAMRHVLKGAEAKAVGRDRTTTLETRDGAGRRTWRSAQQDAQCPRGRGAGRPKTQQRLDNRRTTGVWPNFPDLRKPTNPQDQEAKRNPERTKPKGSRQVRCDLPLKTGGEEGPRHSQRPKSWGAEQPPRAPGDRRPEDEAALGQPPCTSGGP